MKNTIWHYKKYDKQFYDIQKSNESLDRVKANDGCICTVDTDDNRRYVICYWIHIDTYIKHFNHGGMRDCKDFINIHLPNHKMKQRERKLKRILKSSLLQ